MTVFVLRNNTEKGKTTGKAGGNEQPGITIDDVLKRLFMQDSAKAYKKALWVMFSECLMGDDHGKSEIEDLVITYQELVILIDQLNQFNNKNAA